MIYYLAFKNQTYPAVQTKVEDYIPIEISQIQRDKHYMISLIFGN